MLQENQENQEDQENQEQSVRTPFLSPEPGAADQRNMTPEEDSLFRGSSQLPDHLLREQCN